MCWSVRWWTLCSAQCAQPARLVWVVLRTFARAQRTGANSVLPIHKRAPTLTLAADDILYIDLGPIFDQTIEADFARTYVIGVHAPTLERRLA